MGLRKQAYQQRRPSSLAGFVRDQVLANLNSHIGQFPLLAMDRDRVVGGVGHAVGLVVADDDPVLALQELQQGMGEARVTTIPGRRGKL